jgi:hypothetical protein
VIWSRLFQNPVSSCLKKVSYPSHPLLRQTYAKPDAYSLVCSG